MKTDFPFHHSLIEQQREEKRRVTVRSWLMAALVVAMYLAGCLTGFLLHLK